jgi:uncharacterized membrane protein
MKLALGIIKFNGSDRAQEVLEGYMATHPNDSWPFNAGIIVRHRTGRISVYQNYGFNWREEDEAPAAGLGIGAMTGMLIGALAGPAGMAVGGSLGAAYGGILGAVDQEDEEPLYEVIRGKMEKGSSAILLLADDEVVDKMFGAFEKLGVDSLRRSISDSLRGQLVAAVRVVAREEPQPTAH